ncbi:hypothetical protein CRG98_015369 [Punica granatum]|uniref:S-protein homolog n=1 Tax=Punica granatum TaxID=22663 RepID=A0A2I0K6S7_PUNGR|nr:hypothetical protein CRG98_015369 [Punica granatum]
MYGILYKYEDKNGKSDKLEALFDDINVSTSNQLPNGAPFTIHGKSGDDDLGSHVIGAGQSYGFSFKVNFFETTLFFCGVGWQGGQVEFDIYEAKRDFGLRCNNECKWQVRGDAVVGFSMDGGPNPDIVIPWK